MKKYKRLNLFMLIFAFLLFIIFGIIVTTEKIAPLYTDRIHKKILNYYNKEYPNLKDETTLSKTKYKNTKYYSKVVNNINENLYFYIYYANKKITTTYKKDYYEGNTLLSYNAKIITTKLNNKNYKVSFTTAYNELTNKTKENLLTKNITTLNLYTLSTSIKLTAWNASAISKDLISLNDDLTNKKAIPSNYNITFSYKSIRLSINNLTPKIVTSTSLNDIINAIINEKESNLLTINNITYTYVKEGK